MREDRPELPGIELSAPIGDGGWSVVWAGVDAHGREVAAKVLALEHRARPEAVARFLQEGRLLAGLPRPGFPEVFAIIERPVPTLVMERLFGADLEARIAGHGPASPEDVTGWMVQVGTAVEAMHRRGVLHRDLKPGNLFLCADGRVVVLDLGLAKDRGGQTELLRTVAGAVLGTPLYMAPEQARGLPQLGPEVDVWSLGLVAVWLLTGDRYWRASSRAELGAAVFSMPLYRPSSRWPALGEAFDRWFLRSCSRDPTQRFTSPLEQVEALAAVLRGEPFEAPPWTSTETLPLGAALSPERTPLPRPRTPLLGRERELARAEATLCDPRTALLTVIGVGGSGKTHFAQEVATRVEERFADGVYYLGLEALGEASLFGSVLAEAIGLGEGDRGRDLDRATRVLRTQAALLVLDNAEHLDLAAEIDGLLAACPELTVLCTSRAALDLRAERRLLLQPLSVPPAGAGLEAAAAHASVQLLVERIRTARPDFDPGEEDAAALVELARRLDGLPLALELVATRMRLMSPARVLARFGGQLAEVEGRAPDLPARQRTMRAALDGSVDLLDEPGRRALAELSVFADGASLDGLEAVLSDPEGAEELVDHGLARVDAGRVRTLMLVREYGAELLDGRGARDVAEARFLGWMRAEVRERAERLQRGEDGVLPWLDAEVGNIRAALGIALARGEGAGLAGALTRYWYLRGHYEEGRRWLARALELEPEPTAERALALVGAGRLAFLQCDYPSARALLEEGAALYAALGDAEGEDRAGQSLGSVAREQGDYADSLARHRASLRFAEARGDALGAARAKSYIGFATWLSGELDAAEPTCREARDALKALGDTEGWVTAQVYLGAVAHYRGRHEEARRLCAEALRASKETGFPEGTAWARDILALAHAALGEPALAAREARKAARTHARLGDLWRTTSVLETLARLAEPSLAAELLGGAEALRAQIGVPRPPVERAAVEAVRARLPSPLPSPPLERLLELAQQVG